MRPSPSGSIDGPGPLYGCADCDDLEAKLRRDEHTAAKLVEAVVAELVG